MIDIHCHILPYLDDGPQIMDDALQLATIAVDQGIKKIIATPHTQNGEYSISVAHVKETVDLFNQELAKHQIPLVVSPGHEIRVTSQFETDLIQGKYLFLDDKQKYILIEFSSSFVPSNASQLVHNLVSNGIVPIIAHPERNAVFHRNSNLLYELVEKGALTQITANSVVGKFGSKIQKYTNKLLKNNLTHCIASDAHNTKNRVFFLKEAHQEIEKRFGSKMNGYLLENSKKIAVGEDLLKRSPSYIKSIFFPFQFKK
ncbi:tyrosine-protein phosphatase [Gottfriedia solisilvae]|uniref:Tyrosine-protein phosphatase n=1 Tax=Gottfriedia solisilvae TaxID=1516104 RepID=A0A8J3AQ78_9BACI|nr:CpsB/CapC family capsule biosynthesis tyrosine phosphatase [Gottfriedia solisilvae]GGI16704.1 tyrosine protein phosphatase [Gottfriedia solisilvae]